MVKTVEAIFDGHVFLSTEPFTLMPNTPVRIVIDSHFQQAGFRIIPREDESYG